MSLSDKKEWLGMSYYYQERWIKESIKELKEEFKGAYTYTEVLIKKINKIFGEELTNGGEK